MRAHALAVARSRKSSKRAQDESRGTPWTCPGTPGETSPPRLRRTRSTGSSTAPHSDGAVQRFRVAHPFHPLHGHEFELVKHSRSRGEDRVYYEDDGGRLVSLSACWTSAVEDDPFVAVSASRARSSSGSTPAKAAPERRRIRASTVCVSPTIRTTCRLTPTHCRLSAGRRRANRRNAPSVCESQCVGASAEPLPRDAPAAVPDQEHLARAAKRTARATR